MATCDDLPAFFDGELSPEVAEAFRNHLATCERCIDDLGTLLLLDAWAVEYRQRRRKWWRRAWRWVFR